MNIKEKFLELTKRTYPHGTEHELIPLLSPELQKDEFGNLFIKIGESDTMFTCHLDTVSTLMDVTHVIDGNTIKTDGKSILGADDKAGVAVLSYMIENKTPGLYYFFLGEECGCVGSRKVSAKHKIEKVEGITKVVSFDRRNVHSIITYQCGQRCCSEKFGEELAKALNAVESTFVYVTDPTGILTDSCQFTSVYPECTNISVGYYSEHTWTESINIDHLEKLAIAATKLDWGKLPVERDPSKTEYKTYSYSNYNEWDDYDSGYGARSYGSYNNRTATKPVTTKKWFFDGKFDRFWSNIELDSANKVVSISLHKDRIAQEKVLIEELLQTLDLEYKSCTWDGMKLKVLYHEKKDGFCSADHTSECDRNDMIEYLSELDYSSGKDIDGVSPYSREDDDDDDDMSRYQDGFCY